MYEYAQQKETHHVELINSQKDHSDGPVSFISVYMYASYCCITLYVIFERSDDPILEITRIKRSGPVNAHLISGPSKRTKLTKPGNKYDQRTNGPVSAHLISWPSKAQNIQNQENIW